MDSQPSQTHQMVLERTLESGQEEWYCPTCGFRFLMQWPPNYKRIILEEGDQKAKHSGGKGGVSMGAQITQELEEECLPEETPEAKDNGLYSIGDEAQLSPWVQWMEQIDFDNLWRKKFND